MIIENLKYLGRYFLVDETLIDVFEDRTGWLYVTLTWSGKINRALCIDLCYKVKYHSEIDVCNYEFKYLRTKGKFMIDTIKVDEIIKYLGAGRSTGLDYLERQIKLYDATSPAEEKKNV